MVFAAVLAGCARADRRVSALDELRPHVCHALGAAWVGVSSFAAALAPTFPLLGPLGAQPHDDALHDVPAARDRREERRLVDDDEPLVPVHDVDPLRPFLTQVNVEVGLRRRFIIALGRHSQQTIRFHDDD